MGFRFWTVFFSNGLKSWKGLSSILVVVSSLLLLDDNVVAVMILVLVPRVEKLLFVLTSKNANDCLVLQRQSRKSNTLIETSG